MIVWYAGADFGQSRDWTSFGVIEESRRHRPVVTLLKTWKPERPDCLDALPVFARLIERDRPDRVLLGLDSNGLGRDASEVALEGPLASMCEVFPLIPCDNDLPHGPSKQRPGAILVGKKNLVGAVVQAVNSGELALAPGLEEAEAFARELEGLRAIPTRKGTTWTYSHADQRKGSHDDRISAVANALFLYRYARPETAALDRVYPANRRTSA